MKNSRFDRLYRKLVAVGLVIGWLLLFTATHLPSKQLPSGIELPDKMIHYWAYTVLGLHFCLFIMSRAPKISVGVQRCLLYVGPGIALYGAFDEITQPLTGRSCEFMDWVSDALGALTALTVTTTAYFLWKLLAREKPVAP